MKYLLPVISTIIALVVQVQPLNTGTPQKFSTSDPSILPSEPLIPPKTITEEFKTITAQITAYTALETCGQTCIMANGKKAGVGYVACPRNIKLGTKVEIGGIRYECGDRTAIRYDGRFDIFMGYTQNDYQKAKDFGIKTLEVKIYVNTIL